MERSFIEIQTKAGEIVDEYSIKRDKQKAYQIFAIAIALASMLTILQFIF